MNENELDKRKGLSFLQAEGLEPLPRLLVGTKVTSRFQALCLQIMQASFGYQTSAVTGSVPSSKTRNVWVQYFGKYADELPSFANRFIEMLKNYISDGAKLLDLTQWCVRNKIFSPDHYALLQKFMIEERIGYRFVGAYHNDIPTLMPVSDEAEAEDNQRNYSELSTYPAATTHFRQAVEELKQQHFRGSITESISAVESLIKTISGNQNVTLGTGLKLISKDTQLNSVLKSALEKLYGWTNTPNGMRHALSDDAIEITEAEAQFMLSSCLAFAAWLKRSQIQ